MRKSKTEEFLTEMAGEELTFATAMRCIRECDEMSQEAFGKLLGSQKSYICDIEAGRTSVTFAQAVKFAKILGHSETVFLTLAINANLKKQGFDYRVKLIPA